ncbi:response regulator [Cohnella massiliensis]|uniref:response regulator n=1 Tax=Cohnella massiliensis TaxID=1816691 RepID=UPI0009BB1307|nr:response regulator [Cohnella massiliensis]
MYKVLVADDEAWIREGIASAIRGGCPRYDEIYEAADGEEALNVAQTAAPDLIITDIQMPNRSGIELIEQVKADYPDVAVIIISGYDDFEYARMGLKLAVNDYLLKPVESRQLVARLNLLAEELDRKQLFRKDQAELQKIVAESLPLYRERLYRNLIEGGRDPAELADRARQLGLSLDSRYWAAAAVRFDWADRPPHGGLLTDAMAGEIVAGTASRYAQELQVHYFFVKDSELALLIGSDEPTKETGFWAIDRYLTRLGRALQKNVNPERLNIALGSVCESCSELPLSYQQAQEAMLLRLSVKNRTVLNFEELGAAAVPETNAGGRADEIVLRVKLLDKGRARPAVRDYIEEITSVERTHPHWVKLSILELAIALLKVMGDAKLSLDSFLRQKDVDPYANVYRLDTTRELEDWLAHFAERCIAELERSKTHKGASHVEKVKQYVEAHFSEKGLALSEAAANLFLSPNYLRQLFRQETGESFVEYVTRFRMERALRYLQDPTLKIQDVAEKVGFEEQRYFSSCFKKHFQMTPTEYREAAQHGLV